jgi:sulfonate transport system ATP-binding protein
MAHAHALTPTFIAERQTLPPKHASVDVRNVSKSFVVDGHVVQALRGVSLAIEPGEFVSLIGPSGCGKSTLLRLLTGLEPPDHGVITVGGERIVRPSLDRGIVFQDHRLLPWLTVAENVLLSLHSRPGTNAEKRDHVSRLLGTVGLAGFENAYPHQLSGGMAQRAAIARGLAPNPQLLLLDEPLGALDSLTRGQLQGELMRLWQQERVTMVMVTHDVEEALFLSDRIVVLAPRPGHVRVVLPVPLPRPRRRSDPAFAARKQEVLDLLGAGDAIPV